eukprot:232484-Chlamydomonas_euryale.AAC.1
MQQPRVARARQQRVGQPRVVGRVGERGPRGTHVAVPGHPRACMGGLAERRAVSVAAVGVGGVADFRVQVPGHALGQHAHTHRRAH